MQTLNLPSYEYKIKIIDGKTCIFDVIRKKYVVLTPEEWVRQHFINFIVHYQNYPKGRISVEKGMNYSKNVPKRTDILVYDVQGKVEILIETKAPSVKIDEKTFYQLAAYNKIHQSKYLAVSNGLDIFCFSVEGDKISTLNHFPKNQ